MAESIDVLRRAPGNPLPVLVLTGFLGAGKTTLLNYLLSGLAGARVAALVNDFGAVEVDALNIASRVDSTISLAGGCMCCEIDVGEVDAALANLAAPEADIDLVVIEASGLAEPDVLASMVRRQPRDTVSYAGLVNVIDAAHFFESATQHPQLRKHLAISDLLVVTKGDVIDTQARAEFQAGLRDLAPNVPITHATYGRVDLRLFFESAAQETSPRNDENWDIREADEELSGAHEHDHAHSHDHAHDHAHMHDAYTSCVAVPVGVLHPRRLLSVMGNLPAGLFRAKGRVVVASEDGPWSYQLNVVGRMLDLTAEGPSGPEDKTEIVLIGIGLDPAAAEFLDTAIVQEGEVIVAEDRFGLEPYLVAPDDASDAIGWLYEEEKISPLVSTSEMLFDPEDPDSGDPTQTP